MFFILFLFKLLHILSVECVIVRHPSDVKYYPGGTLRLNCSSDITVPVAWLQNGTNIFRSDAMNQSYDQLLVVDRSIGYDLVAIHEPTVSYCGIYSCVENNGYGPAKAYAVVSVAEKLVCSANLTAAAPTDVIQFTCTAEYCDVSVPTVYCRWNVSSGPVQVTTTYPTPKRVKAVVTEQANRLFQSVIICNVSYGLVGNFSTVLPSITEITGTTLATSQPSSSQPSTTPRESAESTSTNVTLTFVPQSIPLQHSFAWRSFRELATRVVTSLSIKEQLCEIVRRCIQADIGLATASFAFSLATLVSTGIMWHKRETCSPTCQFAQLAVAAGGVALNRKKWNSTESDNVEPRKKQM